MKSSSDVKALTGAIASAAQIEYDRWDETDQDTFAGGGICHYIAEKIAEILDRAGIYCQTVSSNYEQHVYTVAKLKDGVFKVDIHWSVYERGGGFSWTKLPDITFDASDVSVERLDSDVKRYAMYVDEEVKSFSQFTLEDYAHAKKPRKPRQS